MDMLYCGYSNNTSNIIDIVYITLSNFNGY